MRFPFLELFCIARDKDALVAGHMFVHNDEVHDWEVDFVSSIFNALYSVRTGWGGEDKFLVSFEKAIF